MAKIKTFYVCQKCGYESFKWMGKCPECQEWNTFIEEVKETQKNNIVNVIKNLPKIKSIKDIESSDKERYSTDIEELNRVLGGGLVKGSLTLISGAPGIGKSTLLLQTANNIANRYGKVMYISGEESEQQIKIRAERLNINSDNLYILSETKIDIIEALIEEINPIFVIIDSIQTVYREEISSAVGSVSQVRECSNFIMRIAKNKNIPFFIVAHITKQGELAGPRVLEHMVDSVLSFEGERTEDFRILRTMKNRFGTTSEIGVFEMREEGLVEIYDPSSLFLEDTSFNQEGSMVVGLMEGTRPLLVEIQALVTETKAIMPRRTSVGIDNGRLNLILAVLEKKLKIPFYNCDVYVNVVGGLSIDGTTADLGIALALISSAKSRSNDLEKTVVIGEVGLTGEIRAISACDRLVNEAEKMGFSNIIIPKRNMDKINNKKLNITGVKTLKEAMNKIFS